MIFGLFDGKKKRVAEMIAAARVGDTEKVKQLLSKGADINAPEPASGDTPLLAAIDKSQWATAAYLLKQRADLSVEDKNGNSALYFAVSRGDSALAMVNLLLEAGAPVELCPKHGDNAGATPLHIACATGANGCLESLLRHGASAMKQLPSGATPMHTAAIGGDQRTIELLCKAGGSVTALNNDKRTPLHNCCITGNAKAATALIKQGSPVDGEDAEGCTPLMRAVMKNHADVVKILLEHGADSNAIRNIDEMPMNPLLVAAVNGHDDVLRVLLDNGANVTAKVEGIPSPVDAARINGHTSTVSLLEKALKRQSASARAEKAVHRLRQDLISALNCVNLADIKRLAILPQFRKIGLDLQLIVQSLLGDAERVKLLLSEGANPNAAIPDVLYGAPVLYVAAGREESTDVVALLLDAGADPHLAQEDGSTALHVAAKRGNARIARLLIEKGSNPDASLANGLTPLMDASVQGNIRMVDALIEGGADINAVAERGFCAFSAAIDNRHMKLAEHLLQLGANPSFGDVDTLPLAIAEHGSISLIKAIEARGGSIILPNMLARVAFIAALNKDGDVLDHVLNNGADLCYGNDLNYSPLILASLANHPELVERYMKRGDDANHLDIDMETALSLAVENEHDEVIDILRRYNAQVVEYMGFSQPQAMLQASADGALGTILNLHDDGVSVNIVDAEGNSPLMLAARKGYVGVVRTLYHLGADINHKNREGMSASNFAKMTGQQKVLKTLMEFYASDATRDLYGFDSEDGERTFDAYDAILGRHTHPLKEKLPYDVQEHSDGPDEEAGESGDENESSQSEKNPTNVSEDVAEMLTQLEALLDQPHIIKQLSAQNREIVTARIKLIWADGEDAIPRAQLEELSTIREFLESQSEVEEPDSPLVEAVSTGKLRVLKKLIKDGLSIHATRPDGTTLLMLAVENGRDSIVKELLISGVDVNHRNDKSITALFIATYLGNEDLVKLLIANGADINIGHIVPSSQGASGGQTALTVAAGRKNLSMCKLLLELGADLDVITEAGYSALMWSLAGTDDDECAKFLLQAGANPDPDAVPSVSFATLTSPLVIAAANGLTRIVRELIRRKVRLDKPDGNGWTALNHAANSGHFGVVAALIKAGASVDVADRKGCTALMNAACHGYFAICQILIKAGADVNAVAISGETALSNVSGYRAAGRLFDSLNNFKKMLDQATALLNGDDSEENEGGEFDNLETVSRKLFALLLKSGANPNVYRDGKSLLLHAIDDDDEDLVKLLKDYGAIAVEQDASLVCEGKEEGSVPALEAEHVRDEQGEALLDAVLDCAVTPVAKMLDDGANIDYVNAEGKTALAVAVYGLNEVGMPRQMRRNLMELADYLLRRGAGVNVIGYDPTPLGYAASAGNLYLVKALLQRGADLDAKISGRTTALLTALAERRENCALALIEAGADLNSRTTGGHTALHLASGMGLTQVVEPVLLRMASLVNTVDDNSSTPLMLAAARGDDSIVKLLLRFQADTTMTDSEGRTPADHAIKSGHAELGALLS